MYLFIHLYQDGVEGKQPPDFPTDEFHKCLTSTKEGSVLCIACSEFYHTNKSVEKYNARISAKFLNNLFVICQDHPNLAWTSKLPYGKL